MAKTIRTFSIDSEVYERFQRIYPNQASSFCEAAMRKRLELDDDNLEGVNLEILEAEEKQAQKIADEAKAKLSKIKEQKEFITSQRENKEQKARKEEKKRLEALTTCYGCGVKMVEPYVKPEETGGRPFCKTCFLSENSKLREALK